MTTKDKHERDPNVNKLTGFANRMFARRYPDVWPHYLLARPAGELRTNVPRDFEDDWFDVERFIGVLAETSKSAVACRAHAISARRQMHDFFPRQMHG